MKQKLLGIFFLALLVIFTIGGCDGYQSHSLSVLGSFINIDTTNRGEEIPLISNTAPWSGSAWRGEKISTQLLIWLPESSGEVSISPSGLIGKNREKIPADFVKLHAIKYIKTDVFAEGCDKTGIAKYDSSLIADLLEPLKNPFDLNSRIAKLIWISIDIPSKARPGIYSGTISAATDGSNSVDFHYVVEVLSRELPPPNEWSFHLDLWQNPYAVSRYFNVDPWSEEHLEKMRPTMKMLANSGQKCITATISSKPWGGQTFDPFETMIRKIRKPDGSWSFDYSAFDTWVEFAMDCGINQQINCFSMVSWDNEYSYYDEAENQEIVVVCKPGDLVYEELWGPFLNDFNKHLKLKSWQQICAISMDERSLEDLFEVAKLVDREAPGLKLAFAGRYHPELNELIFDMSVASAHVVPVEHLNKRRKAGYKTSFYVCCVEEEPNTFTFSSPAEASYLAWYAAYRNFDGMLRWSYNSWTENPLFDSRFRRFPAGDTYMVYPGGLSSVRFERLREGIQDFEKISILESDLLKNGSEQSKEKLNLLYTELAKFEIQSLSNIPASTTLAEGKQLLYQLSK